MAAHEARDTPSPSASSIFLPLGRQSRRESLASAAGQVDKETLKDTLNQIHNAACHSQQLTVFNEYTNPPAASSSVENKGITGEIQGGLSGLYNKFRQSVGGTRDLVAANSRLSETQSATDDASSARSSVLSFQSTPPIRPLNGPPKAFRVDGPASTITSTQASRIQSPTVASFDESLADGSEAYLNDTSKMSSKPGSTLSRTSIMPNSAVVSPLIAPKKGPNTVSAEPTVSEVNVNAYKMQSSHSRNTSAQDRSVIDDPHGEPLSRSKSRGDAADRHSEGLTVLTSQPVLEKGRLPSRLVERRGDRGDRGHTRRSTLDKASSINDDYVSEGSFSQPSMDLTDDAVNMSDNSGGKEHPTTRKVAREGTNGAASGANSHSNPLLLMRTESVRRQSTAPSMSTDNRVERDTSRMPLSPSARPTDMLLPRVSQSRLPGFRVSRTNSSDTAIASQMSVHARFAPDMDGVHENGANSDVLPRIVLSKLRSRLLSKEFWMRDENAKDCFHCGEPFSTFRRKHHCRTCGQIFDSKCTSLIHGSQFGTTGSVRVCLPCEAMIIAHDDDSSDYSVEDFSLPSPATHRPRTPIANRELKSQSILDDDAASIVSQSLEQMSKTPTFGIPLRRAIDSGNRSSAVLEYDTDRHIPRPSSSRSLKTSHSIGHGHRRNHSKHQHIRNFKAYHEERAPFHRPNGVKSEQRLGQSAFHQDSIIDPDLAQYLSDDASSGDEQPSIFDVSESKIPKTAGDSDRFFGGLIAAVKKGRSRLGEKNTSTSNLFGVARDSDEISLSSSRARPSRRRNLSVASSVHQQLSPRPGRDLQVPIERNGHHSLNPSGDSLTIPSGSSRMTRSASMRGVRAPPVELNRASLQHVQKLLRQLLTDAAVPRVSNWESALLPLLLRATDDVDPDVQRGDDIDIRHYVKLKKVPGGKPNDSSYVSGLVFTKNLALKSMPRSISKPNILIITFPLEYARHEQHFMSLEPVIRQEREFLENLVNRIAGLGPQILLAERNISGLALDLLEKANIATAYNVKPSVLEAVSRCAQTRIIHSMDKLAIKPAQPGRCENFDVKTYVHRGRKKTYMFISGCPPSLGCTIVLRGAEKDVLSKVKRITEFMAYVVYNLRLETCLMRDEFALIPSQTEGGSMSTRKQIHLPRAASSLEKRSGSETPVVAHVSDVSNAEVSHLQESSHVKQTNTSQSGAGDIPDDIPVPTFYEDLVETHQTKLLSASPFVRFMQPYLLMRARELERRVAYLRHLRDQDTSSDVPLEERAKGQRFTLIQPEMVHAPLAAASTKVREVIHAVHDAEYDKALHNYETQKKQWETYLSSNKNMFDPYAHQNIVVLYSQVCTTTSVPCSGPDMLALGFYNEHETDENFEADCTLGQYVEDLCYRANDDCMSHTCERKLYEHHRQYVHGEAQVSVFIQPHPAKLRGMQDTILMWSQCKICGNETPVIPMSESTWKYSFGKYLELSFWSADLRARAGICPHDLHRDHLRYFGFKDVALRFHYDPITLLEIIVPRLRITWKVDNDLKFRNDVYTKCEQRLNRFMLSVKSRIKAINAEAMLPEKAEACKQEVESLQKRANEDHVSLLKHLQDCYMNSRHWEIIPLNHAVRAMQEKVADWDNIFGEFEKDFFPSEKDIRRLATLQLKKIFLDRDISVTSVASAEDILTTPSSEALAEEKIDQDEVPQRPERPRRQTQLSPEKTQNVLQSVVEEHSANLGAVDAQIAGTDSTPNNEPPFQPVDNPQLQASSTDVQHLDLALRPEMSRISSDVEHDPADSGPRTPPSLTVDLVGKERRESGSAASESPKERTLRRDSPLYAGPINNQPSGIPRAIEGGFRSAQAGKQSSPPLLRTRSQPAGHVVLHREKSSSSATSGTLSALAAANGFGNLKPTEPSPGPPTEPSTKVNEKKLSDRFGLSHLKTSKMSKGHSLIPRSVGMKKDSRVSNLAKHFEQLSREFEKERVRERKQRAARTRQSRVFPLASSKPIVEVYRNVDDAVEEKDATEEPFLPSSSRDNPPGDTAATAEGLANTNPEQTAGHGFHAEEAVAETTADELEIESAEINRTGSDIEHDDEQSDIDRSILDDIPLPDSPEDLTKLSPEEIDLKELPKHERTSLMKMLTNFWAERSSSGWAPLDYPLNASDHIFADCDIIVREDEPSSLIAFALDSEDYKAKLHSIQEHGEELEKRMMLDNPGEDENNQADVMHSLLRSTGTHLKYQFQEGPARMLCKIFYAEQFDAVRRKCGVSDRFVESLSRCLKWDSKGGKTKSLFLKTLDDRFVLKSLSPIETQAFLKFAPAYFQIMSEAFFHELPSVIAKMLGFYQIVIRNPVTGVEANWFLLVMENLFYDRVPTRIFDLKGSMRNRKIQSTGEQNEVLLDENMVEFIYESPLFTREHSKKLLRGSVHNDTLFLARQNVMDYSLMLGIDEGKQELVVGIIDCIRTYTWDKKLESWIKDRGFAGGNKNRPTVTSPKEYKKRFREAMMRYVLEAPNCWHQFKTPGMEKRPLKIDIKVENADGDRTEKEAEVLGIGL